MRQMRTSPAGRAFIRRMEGDVLVAYRDCIGVWTIGTGHTAAAGDPKPVAGMRITEAESDAILSRDLRAFEDGVCKAVRIDLAQNEFDAMVSFAFNVGLANFNKSTVLARLNRGDREGAAAALLSWNRAGGRVVDGLSRRREAERKLFRGSQTPTVAAEKFGELDPVDMPATADAPRPPKTMATSKTGWASIASGASGVGAVVAAAQPALDGAQSVKDAAGQAAGLFGLDGRLAVLAGLAVVIIVGCAFIWWDRRRKLTEDGV